MEHTPDKLLIDLLKATSRSFYLIPHCGTRAARALAPANRPRKNIGFARLNGLLL
jgi:hypothetical protein